MNWDTALVVLQTILILALSGIGIEMANNPPTSKRAKWVYRGLFIVVGLLSIVVVYWQSVRSGNEKAEIRREENEQTTHIRSQYEYLTAQLKAIEQYAQHPPAGLSKAQLEVFVRTQLTAALAASLEGMPNDSLIREAKDIARQLRNLANSWESEYNQDDNRVDGVRHDSPGLTQEEKDKKIARIEADEATTGAKFRMQAKDTVTYANNLRAEILKRFPQLKDQTDTAALNGLFNKLVSGAYEAFELKRAAASFDRLADEAAQP